MIFIWKISRRYKVEPLKSTFQLYVGNRTDHKKSTFGSMLQLIFEHFSNLFPYSIFDKNAQNLFTDFGKTSIKFLRGSFVSIFWDQFPLFATFQNDIYIFGTYYLINFNFFALDKFLFDIFIHSLTPFVFLSSSVFFCLCVFFSFRFPIYLHERLRSPVR